VTPHQYLHDQLAGSASIFTGSGTIPPMSQQTLQQATAAGQEVFPTANSAQAQAVASASQAIFAVLNGTVPENVTGYSLDLATDPQAPVFQQLTSADDLAGALADTGALAGGLWDDIGQFFGDVLHGIEQGAITVAKWTIDVVNKTITLAVQISDQVSAVLSDLAFDTEAAAISLVHSMFNWLGAAVADVLNWLKDLLPWDQIWSWMETFDGFLTGSLQGIANALEHKAVVASGHFFSDLQACVDSHFDEIIAGLGDQPLRPDFGPAPLGTAPTEPAGSLPGSNATNNWVRSKVLTHVTSYGMLADPGVTLDFAEQITTAVESSGIQAAIAAEVTNLQNFFATVWGSEESVGQTTFASLLEVIKGLIDVVLAALDAFVQILIEIIGDAIGVLATMFSAPLPDIPLLSWLWDNVLRPAGNNDAMTLSKLACLVIAAPVALIMALGKQPAPPEESPGIVVPPNPWTDAQVLCSAVLAVTDSVNDSVNAVTETTTMFSLLLNVFDFAANAVVQTLFWPQGTALINWPWDGSWDWTGMTLGEKITNGTYLGYYIPIAIDGAFTVADYLAMKFGASEETTTVLQQVNIALDTVCGIALIGSGLLGGYLETQDDPPNAGWLDVLEAGLGPLPWATQSLILGWLVAQLAIDIAGDWDWSDWTFR
jgi:hypothetical protein